MDSFLVLSRYSTHVSELSTYVATFRKVKKRIKRNWSKQK